MLQIIWFEKCHRHVTDIFSVFTSRLVVWSGCSRDKRRAGWNSGWRLVELWASVGLQRSSGIRRGVRKHGAMTCLYPQSFAPALHCVASLCGECSCPHWLKNSWKHWTTSTTRRSTITVLLWSCRLSLFLLIFMFLLFILFNCLIWVLHFGLEVRLFELLICSQRKTLISVCLDQIELQEFFYCFSVHTCMMNVFVDIRFVSRSLCF